MRRSRGPTAQLMQNREAIPSRSCRCYTPVGLATLDCLGEAGVATVLLAAGVTETELAELEAAFDVGSIAELGERLAHLSANELITVLAALVSGGGDAVTAAEIAQARVDPKAAAAAVADAFRAAFDA